VITGNLAELMLRQRRYGDARVLYEAGVRTARDSGWSPGVVSELIGLALVEALDESRPGNARAALAEALPLANEMGFRSAIADGLRAAAVLADAERDPRRAVRLIAAARELAEGDATMIPPLTEAVRDVTLRARAELGDAECAAQEQDGRRMSISAAIAEGVGREHSAPLA
jgi:hypothetical protein